MAGWRQRSYRADRVDRSRWTLTIDGKEHSDHQSFEAAVQEAKAVERRRRTRRAFLGRGVIIVSSVAVLALVVGSRQVTNPDYGPARDHVERMEAAYRAVLAGADVGQIGDGLLGAVFRLEVGATGAEPVWVITGAFGGDCYLLRWRSAGPPFVAVLAPRFTCEPGRDALSSAADAYDRVAVQLVPGRPIDWAPVLPDPYNLTPWFYPAVFVLGFVVLRTLVGVSIIVIQKGVPPGTVPVERREIWTQPQSDSTRG